MQPESQNQDGFDLDLSSEFVEPMLKESLDRFVLFPMPSTPRCGRCTRCMPHRSGQPKKSIGGGRKIGHPFQKTRGIS